MLDIQSLEDVRGVYLDNVGVKRLKSQVKVKSKGEAMPTIALISMGVGLEKTVKGTHMSRFIEIAQQIDEIDVCNVENILKEIAEKEFTATSYATFEFPYFVEKTSPATKLKSKMDVDCVINAKYEHGKFSQELIISAPIATLCPCSKAISDYGAHNQRTIATVRLTSKAPVYVEDIVEIIDRNASCELYALLKRPDEKYVTEKAYDNPKFVEDVARDIYCDLDKDSNILSFDIDVESQESIHNHNAYATASKKENSVG